MTNPNDPWARRPDEPTEHLGQPGKSAAESLEPLHTSDYTEAYGQPGQPTTAYPGNETYQAWSQGPHPTRELTTYDSGWDGSGTYGYDQQGVPTQQAYRAGAWSPGSGPPEGGPPRPPKRNTGLWIGLGLAVVLLVGLLGVFAGLLFGGNDSATTASETGTSPVPTQGRLPDRGTEPSEPPLVFPSYPGTEDPGSAGAVMGRIDTNDGATLTISSLDGSDVTVHTGPETQVISLAGTSVTDLPAGDLVVVQGDRAPDGSIHAQLIISAAMPGPGR